MMPQGQVAHSQMPQGQISHNQMSQGRMQPGQMAQAPVGQQIPQGQMAQGQMQAVQIPQGHMQSSNHLSSTHVQPRMQMSQMQHGAQIQQSQMPRNPPIPAQNQMHQVRCYLSEACSAIFTYLAFLGMIRASAIPWVWVEEGITKA